MKAVLYARVSTDDQDCGLQIAEVTAWASRAGWELVDSITDTISGAKAKRPGLERVIELAKQRCIDAVLVWKLDRFGRSTLDLLNLLDDLRRHHVRLIATTQGVDTDESSPAGRFFVTVLAAVAEFERELIRERSAAGRRRYREAWEAGQVGKSVHSRTGKDGPPHRPGRIFRRDQAVELREQGWSWRAIARELSVPLTTVVRAVQVQKSEV